MSGSSLVLPAEPGLAGEPRESERAWAPELASPGPGQTTPPPGRQRLTGRRNLFESSTAPPAGKGPALRTPGEASGAKWLPRRKREERGSRACGREQEGVARCDGGKRP